MMIDYPAPAQIPALKRLWARSFPDPESFIDGFFDTAFSASRCRCVTEGKSAIAALYWLDAEYRGQKMAYIYAVATDPACRGKGLCRKLMADVREVLARQGYAACLLMPGEPGLRQMYEKFGYRNCCQIREFACLPGERLPVREIGWQEYAALRPKFLPEAGAVQQGLDFLAVYARFYRGEGFILAAAREENTLLGLELLGNPEAAPGILTSLDCAKGMFRTCGKGRETVMGLALVPGVSLPEYLGLTFD